ncbi:hypothetical protein KJK41_22045 (plasmid) [Bacillus haikouensis]|nr:hypothetical protein KJK41_22045 [Bacillus haikouensis]
MKKESKTVRMAAETKELVDELILNEQTILNEKIKQGLIDRLEENLLQYFSRELAGISLNLTLNITVGSVIEKAYIATEHYLLPEWDILAKSVKELEANLDINKKGVTPRIALDKEVLGGLKAYQMKFMGLDTYAGAKRAVNLGYVIKLVVYAYWKNHKELRL